MINKQNKKIVYSPKYHRQDQQDINLGKNLYQKNTKIEFLNENIYIKNLGMD